MLTLKCEKLECTCRQQSICVGAIDIDGKIGRKNFLMARSHTSVTDTNKILAAAHERRNELQSEMQRIDAVIAAFGTNSESAPAQRATRRGRPKGSKNVRKTKVASKASTKSTGKRRKTATKAVRAQRTPRTKGMSLIRAVAQVLAESNSALSVAQIAEGVSKLGYSTKAATFKTMISQSLGKLNELKVAESKERGVWQSSNGISKYLETSAPAVEAASDAIPI